MEEKIKLVAIDTEFNKKGELLSIGASNHDFKIDFFIKNKVDKKSYQFHGLAEDFLKKHGMDTKEIKNIRNSLMKEFDVFIGFGILKDLQVLEFNKISTLYENNRIIDIKCILDLYSKNRKLTDLANDLDIEKQINSAIKHSSSYDSMITYLIFFKIFEIEYNNDYSYFEQYIKDFTNLTKAYYWNNHFELDNFISTFSKTEKELKSNNKEKEKNQKLRYYIENDFIYFINNMKKIEYRFPNEYVEEKKLINYIPYEGKKNEIYGIKFFNKVIKENFKQYSFI